MGSGPKKGTLVAVIIGILIIVGVVFLVVKTATPPPVTGQESGAILVADA